MAGECIIQRAFALAASGSVQTVAEIEKALKREGYTQVHDHLSGPSLRSQLQKLLRQPASHGERGVTRPGADGPTIKAGPSGAIP